MSLENLRQRDRQFLWHPLTQHGLNPDILPIASAKGAYLFDDAGNRYIDAISSWYCSVYGHSHPRIIQAVQAQLEQLDHVVFSGFTHEPAVRLTEALLSILPENQSRVFYSDNGSTAAEVGIKMALQYFFNQGESRSVILALENGFHGDTFGAMSVSGLSVYNGPFEKHFIAVERIPVPQPDTIDSILHDLEIRLQKGDIAACIYEPLVQGAAAMQVHDAEDLDRILKLLRNYDVLLIADEVMTGFGKTGTYFASEQIDTKPDIMCLSKALTAGITPMGATSCTSQVFDAFVSKDLVKGFFHGHTYTANPLACTAAGTAIDLLISDEIQSGIRHIMQRHQSFDQNISAHRHVHQTRQIGVIYALDLSIDMPRYGKERDRLYQAFLKEGVFLRPLGNTIYITPPYIIESSDLDQVYDAIETVLEKI